MLKMKHAVLVLLAAALSAGAGPLPDAVVPGEIARQNASVVAADMLKRLASPDQAVYGEAYDDCVYANAEVLKLLEAADQKPGVDAGMKPRLDAALLFRKPLDQASKALHEYNVPRYVSVQKLLLKAYDQGKHRDTKWDTDAEAGLGWFGQSRQLYGFPDWKNGYIRAKYYIDRVVAAGCDDPAVYVAKCFVDEELAAATPQQAVELFAKADAADRRGETAPYVKTLIDGRIVRTAVTTAFDPAMVKARLDDMVTQFKKMLADPDLEGSLAADTAFNIDNSTFVAGVDPGSWFDRYEPALEARFPNSAAVWMQRGRYYERYSWVARGHGYANTVTPAMWDLFKKRMDLAHEALEKSWSIDPRIEQVPEEMLTVILGSGGDRDEFEKWFRRGTELNPNDIKLYRSKLEYLQPRWHGSPEEMVKFGKECLATELYRTDIPLILIDVHLDLAKQSGDPEAYLAQPDVWNDITTTYERILTSRPKATGARMVYAETACKAGQWDKAQEQFNILGDLKGKFSPDLVTEYNYYRRKAEKATKKPE